MSFHQPSSIPPTVSAKAAVMDSSMARANTRDTSFFMRSSSFYFSFSAP